MTIDRRDNAHTIGMSGHVGDSLHPRVRIWNVAIDGMTSMEIPERLVANVGEFGNEVLMDGHEFDRDRECTSTDNWGKLRLIQGCATKANSQTDIELDV